ncbi:YwqG family protein [Actinomadura sp. 1N219]|uniref:YwqG family protein n=1 Tax=Actinomadura sp. 1N219 TaxID=3375152 RepID=UPI0037B4E662
MDHFAAQYRRLRSLLAVFLPPEITAALMPLARPALRLGADGEAPVRLGGAPLLPPDETWPQWNGRPLDFLGAIDFADLAHFGDIPGLPSSGRAAFYYASETPRPWGDEAAQQDGWRIYTGDLKETVPPSGASAYPQTRLSAAPFLSLPSPQEISMRRLEATHSGFLTVYEQLHAVWSQHASPDESPAHQLGGWPALVQRPIGPDVLYASTGRPLDSLRPPPLSPDEQRAVEEWRLLLQLDSDERLGWYWGDPGRIYFCARPNDPLERSWLTLQAA